MLSFRAYLFSSSFPSPQPTLITSKRYRRAHNNSLSGTRAKHTLVPYPQYRYLLIFPSLSAKRSQTLFFQQFQVLLTLFPKFFSSFPHGTCSLSVSHLYLALCETYHTFCVQLPMNATLRKCTVRGNIAEQSTGLSPSLTFFSKKLLPALPLATLLKTTIQKHQSISDFHFELFPVHSPLLRESLLFSFPPLNYMLKFSG